jgi:glycosyltransferase involved in cell wall biosynthesis
MEKTGKPFFTIITSTLNVIDTIERCVKSVAEQTFRDYEHIIVDGASTDGTVEFLNLRKELFSVFISEPDTGIYNAWNKALKYAQGEWILFLGADDILADKNVLTDVAGFIRENKAESGIVYGDVMLVSKGRYEEKQLIRVLPEEVGEKRSGNVRPILPCHSGIFHHKKLLQKFGPFDENYRVCADAKVLLSALFFCEKKNVFHLPRVIYKMTIGGISSTEASIVARENIRVLDELGIPYSIYRAKLSIAKLSIKIAMLNMLGEKITYKIIDYVRTLHSCPK